MVEPGKHNRAEDDFFAFGDPIPVTPPKKKKKKKKKNHLPRTPSLTDSPSRSASTSVLSPVNVEEELEREIREALSSKSNKGTQPKLRRSPRKKKSDTQLETMLGLSPPPSEIHQEPPNRAKAKSKKAEQSVAVAEESDDDFLDGLDGLQQQTQQVNRQFSVDAEVQENDERAIYFVAGKKLRMKNVRFVIYLTIDISTLGITDRHMQIEIKGKMPFRRIIEAALTDANIDLNDEEPILQKSISDIVVYIQELNVVMRPVLKVGKLLTYQDKLTLNDSGKYEIHATITSSSDAERLKNFKEEAEFVDDLEVELENQDLDKELTLTLRDPTGTGTKVIVKRGLPIKELIELYIARLEHPFGLKVELSFEGILLDPEVSIDLTDVVDNSEIEASYDKAELARLKSESKELDYDLGDDTGNIDELIEDSDEGGEGYFLVNMKGKDGVNYKVQVRSETVISALSKHYLKKAGKPANTKIKLFFDHDELPMNSTISDADMEEDDLIDVAIS